VLSAVLVMVFAPMTVGVAVYMVSRQRRREREAEELVEAELHAAELAAESKGPKGA
jgi:hypothetical protein